MSTSFYHVLVIYSWYCVWETLHFFIMEQFFCRFTINKLNVGNYIIKRVFDDILSFVKVLILCWPEDLDFSNFRELFPFDIFVHQFIYDLFGFKVIWNRFGSEHSDSNSCCVLGCSHILNLTVFSFIEHSNKSRFPCHDHGIFQNVVHLIEQWLVLEMNVISVVFLVDFPGVKDGL